jgi:hypothetical protein
LPKPKPQETVLSIDYQARAASVSQADLHAAYRDAFGVKSAAGEHDISTVLAENPDCSVNDAIIFMREMAGDMMEEYATVSMTEAAVAAMEDLAQGRILKESPVDPKKPGSFLVEMSMDVIRALGRVRRPSETISDTVIRLAAMSKP